MLMLEILLEKRWLVCQKSIVTDLCTLVAMGKEMEITPSKLLLKEWCQVTELEDKCLCSKYYWRKEDSVVGNQ